MKWSGPANFVGIAIISASALLATRHARADGFAADRFQPAPAGSDWFAQDSLHFREQPLSLGLTLDWAHDPLVSRSAIDGTIKEAILRNQTTARLGVSGVLFGRVRLDAELPFSLQSGQGSGVSGGLPKPVTAALGDVRLAADVLLLDGSALRLALGIAVELPSGDQGAYSSDGRVRVSPRLALAGDASRFAWAVQAGVDANRSETVGGAPVQTRLTGGASLGYCSPERALCVGPEVDGSAVLFQGARFHQAASAPVEGLLGVHLRFHSDWQWGLGVGTALDSGFGAAVPRALASLQWSPRAHGELPPREQPALPHQSAEPTSPRPPPALPPARPAILVPIPSVPTAPPPDATPPSHAAPLTPSLPPQLVPPQLVPPALEPPAPLPQQLPTHPLPRPDDDALPLPPLISPPDELQLPSAPLPLPALTPLVNKRLVTDQRIDFEAETAKLARESEKPLQQLRIELAEHPEYARVEIGGHTAYPGGGELNLRLSRERAEAVRAWLIEHGIDASRLTAVGYGNTRPLFVGATEVNIRKNRRIELQVLEVKP